MGKWRVPNGLVDFPVSLNAAVVFACLVGIMWGAHNPGTGMPSETAFAYTSETTSALRGFLYEADPLRIHTSTFYHLGYLLGEAFGVRGSYVPYQIVYGLLWWARGFLVFLILRRFLPDSPWLAYAAGALSLVHSCDGATTILGQMNQYGFMFWMVLAMYSFVRAWDATHGTAVVALAAVAAVFEYMALWSYESEILLILAFPVALIAAGRKWRKPGRLLAWYSVPLVYIVLTYVRYVHSGGQSYQESVVRKTWGLGSILSDWAFNIANSLAFWTWARDSWFGHAAGGHVLAGLAVGVFLGGWLVMIRREGDSGKGKPLAPLRSCWILLGAGFATLALSFPVYLLLASARSLWRTQLLSGIGFGIFTAAVLGLLSWLPIGRLARTVVVFAAASVLMYEGSASAMQKAARNRWIWDLQRETVAKIFRVAPNVHPGTVVVLVNVTRELDPFKHDMWFDLALRLMYPGIAVTGDYYYDDGTPAPGSDLVLEGSAWRPTLSTFGRLVSGEALGKTIFIDAGTGKLLRSVPAFLCKARCAAGEYDPSAAIVLDPVSPVAAHRFGLDRRDVGALF